MDFTPSQRSRVRRLPRRAAYDQATIYEILDAGYLCHVGFVVDDQPFVIPTLYGRHDDTIYLHGSAASRMLKILATGIPACLSVAHVDGLVLARSAFHHSINYRSAVLFGTARLVEGDQKLLALRVISDQVAPARWQEVREPNDKELKATTVLQFTIENASAKIRTGPPGDEQEDYDLPIWAGVVPVLSRYGTPENDPLLTPGIDLPPSVRTLTEQAGRPQE